MKTKPKATHDEVEQGAQLARDLFRSARAKDPDAALIMSVSYAAGDQQRVDTKASSTTTTQLAMVAASLLNIALRERVGCDCCGCRAFRENVQTAVASLKLDETPIGTTH